MRERPISVTTGQPSKRGKRLKSVDGLTWKQRNREAVNARKRALYAQDPEKHRQRQAAYKRGEARQRVTPHHQENPMSTLHDTYTTQSQADTFCRTYNGWVSQGRFAAVHRAGPGEYQVWLSI